MATARRTRRRIATVTAGLTTAAGLLLVQRRRAPK